MDESTVTLEDWEQRKRFVGFGVPEINVLRELHLVARTYADQVMDELYGRWLAVDELRRFFPDEATLVRVRKAQRDYFVSLTEGTYDAEYLAHRLRVGRAHQRIGLSPKWYMGAYAVYLEVVLPKVLAAFEYDRLKQARAVVALTKLISLDQALALAAYSGAEDATTRIPQRG